MAQRLAYAKAHKLPLLHDQLLGAGIAPERVEGSPDGQTAWITVANGVSKAAVDAVVAAHDPAIQSAGEQAAAERTAATTDIRDQYQAAMTRLDEIEAESATILASAANAATRTLAAHTRDQARIQRRLLRLLKATLT